MPRLNEFKTVTTRVDHVCKRCGRTIPKGSEAVAISMFKIKQNWQRTRTPITGYYHVSKNDCK